MIVEYTHTHKTMKPFKLEINLDDEQEAQAFVDQHKTTAGRRLANQLGLKGKDSARLATALSNYAWNKITAINCRKHGKIAIAQNYERICDMIYRNTISPLCECW